MGLGEAERRYKIKKKREEKSRKRRGCKKN